MSSNILLQFFVFVLAVLPIKVMASSLEISEIRILSVNSAITPATYDYLQENFKKLPVTSLIVLRLNTPGGLVTTTKDIITMIGREKKPFVVWITPEGASASSAGAIIASAAHFIFMSPGTNIGAATPVGLGEDLTESDGRTKALKDLSALVRALSLSRGRPAAPFEKMITSADSYTSGEAKQLGIIDGIISSESEIITSMTSKVINLDGVETTITFKNPSFIHSEPTPGQKILEVLANPSTAYILFLLGVALIYFEFQAPGGFIAGSIGVLFVILAAISFQILPLDWGSMGLIIVGIVFFILEIFVVSYGILSIAGLAAFIIGSLFLFHGESGFISVQYPIIFSSLAGVITAVALLVWYLYNDQKKQKKINNFFLPIGAKGTILSKLSEREYQVKVRGEIWRAISHEHFDLHENVEVTEVDEKDLIVKIKKDASNN